MKILNYFLGTAWLIVSFIYWGAVFGWWPIPAPPSEMDLACATLVAGLGCLKRND